MRILVTGSSGPLGATIVRQGLALGWTVTGLDIRAGATTDIQADVADAGALARALEGQDAVIHAAALHAPQVGRVPDADFHRVNVQATATLLRLAAEAGVGRVVYTSTTSLYGHSLVPPAGGLVWVDEETPVRPRDIYDETKRAAEDLCAQAGPAFPRGLAVLRIARCFREPAPTRAAHRLHRGLSMVDAAAAHVHAAAGAVPGTFLISALTPFRREEAGALATDAAGLIRVRLPRLAALFDRRGWPLPVRLDRVYDAGRAATVLGFRPRFDFSRL
ncbi:NAD-dependent epimerase/dehydratase family protein [Nitrospirillum pindoramense]|uniref:Nucleoside-diphosphate-sugar epimerase n=1 Tax=Nitrospirillum amazonense TaxID=28077 RepID=A0A560GMB4_9PROT|nr:NAD(P)-dependent oxidoreductase [Nitrospirillum amazonense]TWB35125.1 nucleoside-diphosphate-sugar epimerase [Nitrospirillum amazonense]